MKNSFLFRFPFMLLLACAVAGSAPLFAEKIVSHLYTSERPDAELESILYLAIGIELTTAGFSSTLSDSSSDFRLRADYAPEDGGVFVRLSLFAEDKQEEALAATDMHLRLDDTLDSTVAAAVTALFSAADIRAPATGAEVIEGLLSKPSEAAPGAAEQSRADPAPAAAAMPEAVSAAEPTAATPYIDTSFAAGGLMLFGAATDYFHYGAHGALTAGYAIPLGKLAVTPGLRISATRIFTDAEVSGNPLYVSTAGVNLQYGTNNLQPFRASGVISAGAAVLSTEIGGRLLSKTVPYADLGVHTGLPLGRRFFMGAEVRFLTVFDRDILLIGAVTALALNREF